MGCSWLIRNTSKTEKVTHINLLYLQCCLLCLFLFKQLIILTKTVYYIFFSSALYSVSFYQCSWPWRVPSVMAVKIWTCWVCLSERISSFPASKHIPLYPRSANRSVAYRRDCSRSWARTHTPSTSRWLFTFTFPFTYTFQCL